MPAPFIGVRSSKPLTPCHRMAVTNFRVSGDDEYS